MIETLFDLPPNAAVAWVKKFLSEAWSTPEVKEFVNFCEKDYQYRKDDLTERAEPGGIEHIKIDQILYHLRDQAWHRNQKLLKIDLINSRVRQRLN